MNKLKSLVLAVLFAFAGTAVFAGTAHGIAKRPLAQEQFAAACEKGDPENVLNVKCEEVVAWFGVYRAELQIKTVADLAKYVRSLTVVSCGDGGKHALNREVEGKILHEAPSSRWEREFGAGEECLYDNNRAEIQFSTSCYNTPYEKIGVKASSVPSTTASAVATPTPTPAPTKPLAEAAKEHVDRDGGKPGNVSLAVPVTVNNGGSRATALIIAGSILVAVGGAILYDQHKKDNSTSRTPNPKIRADGSSGLEFRIALPLGGS
jgi:cell division protein FtsN